VSNEGGAGNAAVPQDSIANKPVPVTDQAGTPVVAGGQPVQKGSNGDVIVGDHTVAQGSKATVAGQVISAGSNNVVVNGATHALPPNPGPAETPTPVQVGDQVMPKASNGDILVGGHTVPQGSQTTMGGHVVSAGPNNVVVDGATHAQPATPGPVVQTARQPHEPLQINGQTIQSAPNGDLLIGTQTISHGSAATISGHVISAGPGHLVLDGSTVPLAPPGPTITPPPTTISGLGIQAATNGAILVSGHTLTPGQAAATISGHTISAGLGGVAVVDGSTNILPTPSTIPNPTAIASLASAATTAQSSFSSASTAASSAESSYASLSSIAAATPNAANSAAASAASRTASSLSLLSASASSSYSSLSTSFAAFSSALASIIASTSSLSSLASNAESTASSLEAIAAATPNAANKAKASKAEATASILSEDAAVAGSSAVAKLVALEAKDGYGGGNVTAGATAAATTATGSGSSNSPGVATPSGSAGTTNGPGGTEAKTGSSSCLRHGGTGQGMSTVMLMGILIASSILL